MVHYSFKLIYRSQLCTGNLLKVSFVLNEYHKLDFTFELLILVPLTRHRDVFEERMF